MLTDLLDRLRTALEAPVQGSGGEVKVVTDRSEAVAHFVRTLSGRWQVAIWISGTAPNETQKARLGLYDAVVNVAVIRKPGMEADASASGTRKADEDSLLNLFELVRQLVWRVRFGTLTTGEDGRVTFHPRPGYMGGPQPMALGKTTFSRDVLEVELPPGAPKSYREMLIAEAEWRCPVMFPNAAPTAAAHEWWVLA